MNTSKLTKIPLIPTRANLIGSSLFSNKSGPDSTNQ